MEKIKKACFVTLGITAATFLLISLLAFRIKNNIYVLFPAIGISFSLAIFLVLVDEIRKQNKVGKSHEHPWICVLVILILSLFDSLTILLIRISYSLHEAMIFNSFQVFFTSSLLIAILYFVMREPYFIMEREKTSFMIKTLYLFFSIFFSSYYITSILLGKFSTVSRVGGVYYELDLSREGFGPLYPLVKISFVFVTALIVIFSTIQYLKIKNHTIKRYYSIFYSSLLAIIFFETFVVVILTYIFKIQSATFFGILTPIYSFILAYYVIHIHKVYVEIEKHSHGKISGNGEFIILTKKEAKHYLLKNLKKGAKTIIFSMENRNKFPQIIQKNAIYIQTLPEGYRLGDTLFKKMSDLEDILFFSKFGTNNIIYSDIFNFLEKIPCERRVEILEHYRFLYKAMKGGNRIILSAPKKYISSKTSESTKNPMWAIPPLMLLYLEELINRFLGKFIRKTKGNVLDVLVYMKKYGVTNYYIIKSRICLDLDEEMDREKFSSYIGALVGILEQKKIAKRDDFLRTLRDLFEEYGEEFHLTFLIRRGEINFVVEKEPRDTAMQMIDLLGAHGRTLIISRVNPRILKRRYELSEDISLRWLTTYESDERIYPHLEEIKKETFSFLDEFYDGLLVLDGIEYLIKLHGFEAVLRFLWMMQDKVSTTEAVVLIPINLSVLERKESEMIRRDFHIMGQR